MTNVESMDYMHSHPSTIASLSSTPRNFRRYHKPTIYLPQNSYHACLLWHFHCHSEIYCNTPYVTYHICIPTLAIFGTKLWYFLVVGFLSLCCFVFVMHLISCHHVHCICIRVRLMHSSIFPDVRFAFRRSYVLRCSFLPFFVCGC